MDSPNIVLSPDVFLTKSLDSLSGVEGLSEEKKKQAAKDFESIFISKMLDTMKESIGDWGFEKEGDSKQIKDIFWTYLASELGNNGGFGLWEQIYESMNGIEPKETAVKSLDSSL